MQEGTRHRWWTLLLIGFQRHYTCNLVVCSVVLWTRQHLILMKNSLRVLVGHLCNATTGVIVRCAFWGSDLSVKPGQGSSSVMHKYQVEQRSRLMWVEMPSQVDTTSRCETKYKGPCSVGYARQKMKARDQWEAIDESPPLEQPKSSLVLVLETMSWIGRSQVYHTS